VDDACMMLEDNVKYIGPSESEKEAFNSSKYIKFIITDNCNSNCEYCPSHLDKPTEFASLANLLKIVNFIKILNDMFPREIIMIGGEPTIDPHFLDVMEACRFVKKFVLSTNLSCSLDYLQNIIELGKKMNDFDIRATYHPSIITPKEFTDKVNILVGNNITVSVLLSLTPYNFEEVFKMNDYFKLYRKINRKFSVYITGIRYSKYDDKFTHSQLDRYNNYYRELDDKQKWVCYYYADGYVQYYTYHQILFSNGGVYKDWKCDAGNRYLAIDCDGEVYPCKTYRKEGFKPLFNIFDDNIDYCLNILKQIEKGIICDCTYRCLSIQVPKYSPKFYNFDRKDFYDCSKKREVFYVSKGLNSYGEVGDYV